MNTIDLTTYTLTIMVASIAANLVTFGLICLLVDDGFRRLRNAFITFMGGAD